MRQMSHPVGFIVKDVIFASYYLQINFTLKWRDLTTS